LLHGSGGRTEWEKEAACDRSLVEKLNGSNNKFFREAGGLRKESFKSRVGWLIFGRDV